MAENSRSLRSKVHLAEQAQRAARGMEHDYEEVVRLLEREVAELRAQSSTPTGVSDNRGYMPAGEGGCWGRLSLGSTGK